MGATSKWLRQLIQAAPPDFKRWITRRLPSSAVHRLSDRAFNQVDQAALRRFWQSHQPPLPAAQTFDNGLAVVIPCYNHAPYLEATVTSLINQTYRPYQAIFVEDHSTDTTWNHLQDLMARFPDDIKVTLLRSDRNRGQAAAINLGIEKSEASLYTILNDDDYLMHDALEVIMGTLVREPSIFLIGSIAQVFSGAGIPDGADQLVQIGRVEIPLKVVIPQNARSFTSPNQLNMTHSGTTFFRSAWQQVGGYYSDKSQRVVVFTDRDFQLRVAALFPVAISEAVPFSFWRADSSVDSGLYT